MALTYHNLERQLRSKRERAQEPMVSPTRGESGAKQEESGQQEALARQQCNIHCPGDGQNPVKDPLGNQERSVDWRRSGSRYTLTATPKLSTRHIANSSVIICFDVSLRDGLVGGARVTSTCGEERKEERH